MEKHVQHSIVSIIASALRIKSQLSTSLRLLICVRRLEGMIYVVLYVACHFRHFL
jgi:hypothetical protein